MTLSAFHRSARLAAGACLLLLLGTAGHARQIAPIRVRVAPVPGVVGATPVGASAVNPRLQGGLLPAGPSLSLPASLPVIAAPSVIPVPVGAAAPVPAKKRTAALSTKKPLKLLATGPPGAGKTTLGKMLAKDLGVVHISVGALLRERVKTDPAFAGLAETMKQGGLVDTEIVLQLVKERLSRPDVVENGFLLDGFPRRMPEAKALEAWLGDGVDAVIHFEAPESELRRRILNRGRVDDTEKTFRKRMGVYHEQTEPVIRRLRGQADVISPDVSSSDIEANYRRLLRSVQDWAEDRGE